MNKRENSFPELVAYLDSVEELPFRPGRHDCALFVAGAVAVQTGMDWASPFRGKYRTIAGGLRLLAKQSAFKTHFDVVRAFFPELDPHQAKNGDIGMVDAGNGDFAFGIICGPNIYLVTEVGLGIRPRTEISRAWEV